MALGIGGHTTLGAIRQSNGLSNARDKIFAKLSSGLRINRAADDAAGLAISERLRAQISSTEQGVRNLNDGISALRIAEGALQESSNILNRQRELLVQAGNGTLSEFQRGAIQNEYDSLSAELSRIAEVTEFNGKALLNGDASGENSLVLDSGLEEGSVEVSIASSTATDLLLEGLDVSDPGALAAVDAAREEVVKTRAELGTAENQLESQVRSLRASEAALAESESRIRDTDFANEVAAQTKNSILQEFALAVQGQANASKEAVLKLLGVD